MNGSFDAKICHTDVKFHGVVQNNVKRNLSIVMSLLQYLTLVTHDCTNTSNSNTSTNSRLVTNVTLVHFVCFALFPLAMVKN